MFLARAFRGTTLTELSTRTEGSSSSAAHYTERSSLCGLLHKISNTESCWMTTWRRGTPWTRNVSAKSQNGCSRLGKTGDTEPPMGGCGSSHIQGIPIMGSVERSALFRTGKVRPSSGCFGTAGCCVVRTSFPLKGAQAASFPVRSGPVLLGVVRPGKERKGYVRNGWERYVPVCLGWVAYGLGFFQRKCGLGGGSLGWPGSGGSGWEWNGAVGYCMVWASFLLKKGLKALVRSGRVVSGSVGFGKLDGGLARKGTVWFGLFFKRNEDWLGMAWGGLLWFGLDFTRFLKEPRRLLVRSGLVGYAVGWCCVVGFSMAWFVAVAFVPVWCGLLQETCGKVLSGWAGFGRIGYGTERKPDQAIG